MQQLYAVAFLADHCFIIATMTKGIGSRFMTAGSTFLADG